MPRDGSPRCALISSGVLIRLSRYSKKNASPQRQHAAAEQRRAAGSSALRGCTGAARPLRLDRRRGCCCVFSSPRDAGLLRALQQAVVDLLAALHVALEHAVVDAPCGSSPAPRPSAGSSARPGCSPAPAPPGTRCAPTARPWRSRPAASPAPVWIADCSLTISGCLSPSFSDSCACCCCSCASSAFCCWMKRVRQDRRERVERRRVVLERRAAACTSLPSGSARSSPASPRAFRSASFCTTMFSRSSSEIASFCSR